MTKHIIILLLFILVSGSLLSQNKKDSLKSRHYMSIKDYKNILQKELTKSDSLTFIFKDNDTLVRVTEYERYSRHGVLYEYKDSIFLDFYKQVAFYHKKDSVDKKTRMKYWKRPIKIFFSKSVQARTKRDFLKYASYISKNIDSLDISEVRKIEDSNYIIYYKGDFEYESRMSNYKNTNYYMYWNKRSQIYRCALRIDSETNFNEELRLYQLKDYFFRTLGFFKLSDEFKCESYFSNCFSENKEITPFDLELLKYHYSYGICKGTDLKTFEESHRRIKKEYQKTGRYPIIVN